LPLSVSEIGRCYFCDDAFTLMKPIVCEIHKLAGDSTGVFTSKLVSQLFYEIAVPFDTKFCEKPEGVWSNESYGDGRMCRQAKAWLLRTTKALMILGS